MKELSIEDKAKAYDKAIEVLRSLFVEQAIKHCDRVNIKDITNIFPEFKEPKQEWSEKDEKIRKKIMHVLSLDVRISNKELADINDWLKSLRHQNRWKPSLAQLNALSIVSKGYAPEDIEEIKSLYNDLKKLTE